MVSGVAVGGVGDGDYCVGTGVDAGFGGDAFVARSGACESVPKPELVEDACLRAHRIVHATGESRSVETIGAADNPLLRWCILWQMNWIQVDLGKLPYGLADALMRVRAELNG